VTSTSFAVQVAIKTPVGCPESIGSADEAPAVSCGEDIALIDVVRSHAELIKRRANCPKPAKADNRDSPLKQSEDQLRNLFDNSECAPLRAYTEANACRATTLGEYVWMPAGDLPDGEQALQKLLSRAASGQPFGNSVYKEIIVEAEASHKDETHLALCDVTEVAEILGPPRDCVTVAIITPSKTWVRARIGGLSIMCEASAFFRPSGAIGISFEIHHVNVGVQQLASAILTELQSDLRLAAEEEISRSSDGAIVQVSITATSGIRDSAILTQGWRETLDFDVQLIPHQDQIELSGKAHAMVSRLATGNVADLQGMDDAQRSIYANSLDAKVKSAIQKSCTSFRQQDAKVLFCN
jgi:hypothetical protein